MSENNRPGDPNDPATPSNPNNPKPNPNPQR